MDTQPVHDMLQQARESLDEAERASAAVKSTESTRSSTPALVARLGHLEDAIARIDARLERATSANSSLNERFAALLEQLVLQVGSHDQRIADQGATETTSLASGLRTLVEIIKAQNNNIEDLAKALNDDTAPNAPPAEEINPPLTKGAIGGLITEGTGAVERCISEALAPLKTSLEQVTNDVAALKQQRLEETPPARDESALAVEDEHARRHGVNRLQFGLQITLRDLAALTDDLRESVASVRDGAAALNEPASVSEPPATEAEIVEPDMLPSVPQMASVKQSLQRLSVGMGSLIRRMSAQSDRFEDVLKTLSTDLPEGTSVSDTKDEASWDQLADRFGGIAETLTEQVLEIQPAVHRAVKIHGSTPPVDGVASDDARKIVSVLTKIRTSVAGLIASHDAIGDVIEGMDADTAQSLGGSLNTIKEGIGEKTHQFLDSAVELSELVSDFK